MKVESFEHEEELKVNPDFNPFKSIVEEKPPIKPEEKKPVVPIQPKTNGLQMVIEEKQEVQLQPELLKPEFLPTRKSLPLVSQFS